MSRSDPPPSPQRASTYLVDPQSRVEMTRQLDKSRMVNQHSGLFPRSCPLDGLRDVLDLACGPGGWALEVAGAFPHLQVTGIDISPPMINFARAQAGTIPNASFEVMDARPPLAFPDASFDFVHGRFLLEFMTREAWPLLVAEGRRLLRPGGILCLTEFEMGKASLAPAHQELCGYYTRAMKVAGRSFSATGLELGVIEQLASWLQEAGFQCQPPHTHLEAFAVDYSFGSPLHEDWCQDLLILAKLGLSFIAKVGAASPEEGIPPLERLEQLYQRMAAEMSWRSFRAILLYVRAWGVKPPA